MTAKIPLLMADERRLPNRIVPSGAGGKLVDSFGRVHNNLRISVTDRCNLRCTYCMPEEVTFLPRGELLSFEEIARFVSIAADVGIDKIRLTGGEPLVRRGLPLLITMLAKIPGIRDIGLTTNGILLADLAQALFDAGLTRLNVSLDTLDPSRFRELSRRDGLDRVLAGLNAAKQAGFKPIKINAVAIRDSIKNDAVPLAHYCREHDFELRFIEYMPIGADVWERDKVFSGDELLELLANQVGPLIPAIDSDPLAPAQDYDYSDGLGRVGIIASVSRPFCHSCNRLRLTSDGKLRNCLFAHDEIDVKQLLRDDDADTSRTVSSIKAAIHESVGSKQEGHEINTARFVKPDRTMHTIGG